MSKDSDLVFEAIEDQAPRLGASDRRTFVKGAALAVGGGALGLMALPSAAFARNDRRRS